MSNNYSEQLMECFYNASHAGIIDLDMEGVSAYTEKSASLDEQVTFYVSASTGDNREMVEINKISFTAYGGPVLIATAEFLARYFIDNYATEKSLENINKIDEEYLLDYFKLDRAWRPSLSLVGRAWRLILNVRT